MKKARTDRVIHAVLFVGLAVAIGIAIYAVAMGGAAEAVPPPPPSPTTAVVAASSAAGEQGGTSLAQLATEFRAAIVAKDATISALNATVGALATRIAVIEAAQAVDAAQNAAIVELQTEALAQNASIAGLQTDALDLAGQVAANTAAYQNTTAAAAGGGGGVVDCGGVADVLQALGGGTDPDGAGCPTVWTGTMEFGNNGLDLAMLPYFRSVRTLNGALALATDYSSGTAQGLDQLVSLRGLFPSLVTITGLLTIYNLGGLVDLDSAFPVLESVSHVYMTRNSLLVRGNPFPSLREFTYTGDRTAANALVDIRYNGPPPSYIGLLTCTVVDGWFGALQGGCRISQCSNHPNLPARANDVTMSGC